MKANVKSKKKAISLMTIWDIFVYMIISIGFAVYVSQFTDKLGKYVDVVINSCENGAEIVGGKCDCDDIPFNGNNCQDSSCENGGYTIYDVKTVQAIARTNTLWSCFCKNRYSGYNCEICNAIGEDCTDKCEVGYYGTQCQNVCYADLNSSTQFQSSTSEGVNCATAIENGGSCTYCSGKGVCNGAGGCLCNPGFSGTTCEVECPKTDDGYCSSNGVCSEGVCTCEDGYSGIACEHQCRDKCSGAGICTVAEEQAICVCFDRYRGDHCQHMCPGVSVCSGRGVCDGNGTCTCEDGWEGDSCNCQSETTCNGYGVCNLDGTCSCTNNRAGNCQVCIPDYYGENCDVQCRSTVDCNGHGACSISGACTCDSGWAGTGCDQCAEDVYPLAQYANPCSFVITNATCNHRGYANTNFGNDRFTAFESVGIEVGKFMCKCIGNFSVESFCSECEPNHYTNDDGECIKYCDDNTCMNGVCVEDGSCSCTADFFGEFCDSGCSIVGGVVCSGHGACKKDDWISNQKTKCMCDDGYEGSECQLSAPVSGGAICNGRGVAMISPVVHTGFSFDCNVDADCGDEDGDFTGSTMLRAMQVALRQALYGAVSKSKPYGPMCKRQLAPLPMQDIGGSVGIINIPEWTMTAMTNGPFRMEVPEGIVYPLYTYNKYPTGIKINGIQFYGPNTVARDYSCSQLATSEEAQEAGCIWLDSGLCDYLMQEVDTSDWCYRREQYEVNNCGVGFTCPDIPFICDRTCVYQTGQDAIDAWNAKHMDTPFNGEDLIQSTFQVDPSMFLEGASVDECEAVLQWDVPVRIYPSPRFWCQTGERIDKTDDPNHANYDECNEIGMDIMGFGGFVVNGIQYNTFRQAMDQLNDMDTIQYGNQYQYAETMTIDEMCMYYDPVCAETWHSDTFTEVEFVESYQMFQYSFVLEDFNAGTYIALANASGVMVALTHDQRLTVHNEQTLSGPLLERNTLYTVRFQVVNGVLACENIKNTACPGSLPVVGTIKGVTGTAVGASISALHAFNDTECKETSWRLRMPPGWSTTKSIWALCKERHNMKIRSKALCEYRDSYKHVAHSTLTRMETLDCVRLVTNQCSEMGQDSVIKQDCLEWAAREDPHVCAQEFNIHTPTIDKCKGATEWASWCNALKQHDSTQNIGKCSVVQCDCDHDTYLGVSGSACQLSCPVNSDTGTACGFQNPPEYSFGTCRDIDAKVGQHTTESICDCQRSTSINCDERCDEETASKCNMDEYRREPIRSFDAWGYDDFVFDDAMNMMPYEECRKYLDHHRATEVIYAGDSGICRWNETHVMWGGTTGHLISSLVTSKEECKLLNSELDIVVDYSQTIGAVAPGTPLAGGGVVFATHETYTVVQKLTPPEFVINTPYSLNSGLCPTVPAMNEAECAQMVQVITKPLKDSGEIEFVGTAARSKTLPSNTGGGCIYWVETYTSPNGLGSYQYIQWQLNNGPLTNDAACGTMAGGYEYLCACMAPKCESIGVQDCKRAFDMLGGTDDYEKIITGSGTVSCGGHNADDCSGCMQGNGAAWCNGECTTKIYTIHSTDLCGTNEGVAQLTSAAECESAATELGLSDTTALVAHYSGRPEGCYTHFNGQLFLYWNTYGTPSNPPACTTSRQCLCATSLGQCMSKDRFDTPYGCSVETRTLVNQDGNFYHTKTWAYNSFDHDNTMGFNTVCKSKDIQEKKLFNLNYATDVSEIDIVAGSLVVISGNFYEMYSADQVISFAQPPSGQMTYGGAVVDLGAPTVSTIWITKSDVVVPRGSYLMSAEVYETSNGYIYTKGPPTQSVDGKGTTSSDGQTILMNNDQGQCTSLGHWQHVTTIENCQTAVQLMSLSISLVTTNVVPIGKVETIVFKGGQANDWDGNNLGHIDVDNVRKWTQVAKAEIVEFDSNWNVITTIQQDSWQAVEFDPITSMDTIINEREQAQWIYDQLTGSEIKDGNWVAFTHNGNMGVLSELEDESNALSELLKDLYGSTVLHNYAYGVDGRTNAYGQSIIADYGRTSMMFLLRKNIRDSLVIEQAKPTCSFNCVIEETIQFTQEGQYGCYIENENGTPYFNALGDFETTFENSMPICTKQPNSALVELDMVTKVVGYIYTLDSFAGGLVDGSIEVEVDGNRIYSPMLLPMATSVNVWNGNTHNINVLSVDNVTIVDQSFTVGDQLRQHVNVGKLINNGGCALPEGTVGTEACPNLLSMSTVDIEFKGAISSPLLPGGCVVNKSISTYMSTNIQDGTECDVVISQAECEKLPNYTNAGAFVGRPRGCANFEGLVYFNTISGMTALSQGYQGYVGAGCRHEVSRVRTSAMCEMEVALLGIDWGGTHNWIGHPVGCTVMSTDGGIDPKGYYNVVGGYFNGYCDLSVAADGNQPAADYSGCVCRSEVPCDVDKYNGCMCHTEVIEGYFNTNDSNDGCSNENRCMCKEREWFTYDVVDTHAVLGVLTEDPVILFTNQGQYTITTMVPYEQQFCTILCPACNAQVGDIIFQGDTQALVHDRVGDSYSVLTNGWVVDSVYTEMECTNMVQLTLSTPVSSNQVVELQQGSLQYQVLNYHDNVVVVITNTSINEGQCTLYHRVGTVDVTTVSYETMTTAKGANDANGGFNLGTIRQDPTVGLFKQRIVQGLQDLTRSECAHTSIIVSADTCSAAGLALGLQWGGIQSWDANPIGCTVYHIDGNHLTFFNIYKEESVVIPCTLGQPGTGYMFNDGGYYEGCICDSGLSDGTAIRTGNVVGLDPLRIVSNEPWTSGLSVQGSITALTVLQIEPMTHASILGTELHFENAYVQYKYRIVSVESGKTCMHSGMVELNKDQCNEVRLQSELWDHIVPIPSTGTSSSWGQSPQGCSLKSTSTSRKWVYRSFSGPHFCSPDTPCICNHYERLYKVRPVSGMVSYLQVIGKLESGRHKLTIPVEASPSPTKTNTFSYKSAVATNIGDVAQMGTSVGVVSRTRASGIYKDGFGAFVNIATSRRDLTSFTYLEPTFGKSCAISLSLAECEQLPNYMGTGSWSDYEPGCTSYNDDAKIFYNTHETGVGSGKVETIAFTGGRAEYATSLGHITVNAVRKWTQVAKAEIVAFDSNWNIITTIKRDSWMAYSGSSSTALNNEREQAQWIYDQLTGSEIKSGNWVAFTHNGNMGVLSELEDGSAALSDLLKDFYGSTVLYNYAYGVWGRTNSHGQSISANYGRASMMFLLRKDIKDSLVIEVAEPNRAILGLHTIEVPHKRPMQMNLYTTVSDGTPPNGCSIDNTGKPTYNTNENSAKDCSDGKCICMKLNFAVLVPVSGQDAYVKNEFCVKKETGACRACGSDFNSIISKQTSDIGGLCAIGPCPLGKGNVYEVKPDVTWEKMGSTVTATGNAAQEGASVAISANGKIMATADHKDDNTGTDSGLVRVFEWAPKYVQISEGTCPSNGYLDIRTIAECQSAVEYFGLTRTVGRNTGTTSKQCWQQGSSPWWNLGESPENCELRRNVNNDVRCFCRSSAESEHDWTPLGSKFIGQKASSNLGYSMKLSHDGHRIFYSDAGAKEARYIAISTGTCADNGYEQITDRSDCNDAINQDQTQKDPFSWPSVPGFVFGGCAYYTELAGNGLYDGGTATACGTAFSALPHWCYCKLPGYEERHIIIYDFNDQTLDWEFNGAVETRTVDIGISEDGNRFVYGNNLAGDTGTGDGHARVYQYKQVTAPYKIMESGKCTDDPEWKWITDVYECGIAAIELQVGDQVTVGTETHITSYPPGCWHRVRQSDDKVMMNESPGASGSCGSTKRCLCKRADYVLKRPEYKLRTEGHCTDELGWRSILSWFECKWIAQNGYGEIVDSSLSDDFVRRRNSAPGCTYLNQGAGAKYVQYNSFTWTDVECVAYSCICARDPLYYDWVQMGETLTPPSVPEIRNEIQFGYSVDMSADGDLIVVSSSGTTLYSDGRFHLYKWNGDNYEIGGTMLPEKTMAKPTDRFAMHVTLSADGDKVMVTQPYYDENSVDNDGSDLGMLRVYNIPDWRDDRTWSYIGSPIRGDRYGGYLGYWRSGIMSRDGKTMAAGTLGGNDYHPDKRYELLQVNTHCSHYGNPSGPKDSSGLAQLLDASDPMADTDRAQECANRCQAEGHTHFFLYKYRNGLCMCGSDDCSVRTGWSSADSYTIIFIDNVVDSYVCESVSRARCEMYAVLIGQTFREEDLNTGVSGCSKSETEVVWNLALGKQCGTGGWDCVCEKDSFSFEPGPGNSVSMWHLDEAAQYSERDHGTCERVVYTAAECQQLAQGGSAMHFDIPYAGTIYDNWFPYGCIMTQDRTKIYFNSNVSPSYGVLVNNGDTPMGRCEGDCDLDSDCEGPLKCFQRSSSTVPVPGCQEGGSGDVDTTDYCYLPKGGNNCWLNHCICKTQGTWRKFGEDILDQRHVQYIDLSYTGDTMVIGSRSGEAPNDADGGSTAIWRRAMDPVCEICGEGQYSDSDSEGQCQVLPFGTGVTIRDGLRVGYNRCPKGTYTADCLPCTPGTYAVLGGGSQCGICPEGSYQDESTQSICKGCLPGRYGDEIGLSTSESCHVCLTGQYQPFAGQPECDICPIGYRSGEVEVVYTHKTTGTCDEYISSHEECEAARVFLFPDAHTTIGTSGTHLPTGCIVSGSDWVYFNTATTDVPCNSPGGQNCICKGYHNTVPITECEGCLPGKFAADAGSVTCDDCVRGLYTDSYANSGCTDCPSGFYQNENGKVVCVGYMCPLGTGAVASPPAFQTVLSQDPPQGCVVCEWGKFSPTDSGAMCQDCPWGFVSSDNRHNCERCPREYYYSEVGSECKQCTNSYGSAHETPDVCDAPLVDFTIVQLDNHRISLEFDAWGTEQVIVKFGDKDPQADGHERYYCNCAHCNEVVNRTVIDMSTKQLADMTGILYVACQPNQKPMFLPVSLTPSFKLSTTASLTPMTALTCKTAEDALMFETNFADDVCRVVEDDRFVQVVSPVVCLNVNGVDKNSNGCRCGNTACSTGQYCFAKYNTCQDNIIEYVPTYQLSSNGCTSSNEVPISDLETCSAAAMAIGLPDITARPLNAPASPQNCFYDHDSENLDQLNFNPSGLGTSVTNKDVLLCRYRRCKCTGGIPASGCLLQTEEKCTKCDFGRWLNSQNLCQTISACDPGEQPANDYTSDDDVTCEACLENFWSQGIQCLPHRTTCDPGSEIDQSGTAESDATCTQCLFGKYSATGSQACEPWSSCAETEFQSLSGSTVSDRTCNSLRQCFDFEYEATAPTLVSDRVCRSSRQCFSDEFEVEQQNATVDRICQKHTSCAAVEYEVSAPNATVDRVCSSITDCNNQEHESVPPSTTSDRTCVPNVCLCVNGTVHALCLEHGANVCGACPENFGYNELQVVCEKCAAPAEYNNKNDLSPCKKTGSCDAGYLYKGPALSGEVFWTISVEQVEEQNKYVIDGDPATDLQFKRGRTYIFTNIPSAHPLRFSENPDGIHSNGIPFTQFTEDSGSITLVVNASTPNPLYYYCENHANMGGVISIEDQYEHERCVACPDGTYQPLSEHYQVNCLPQLINCSETEYERDPASAISDRVCANITVCSDIQYETSPTNATADRVCTNLTICSETEYESAVATATTDRVCNPYSVECEDGQYESLSRSNHTDRDCSNITQCSSNQYESEAAGVTTDRTCLELTVCSETQFELKTSNATVDRVCSNLTQCSELEYEWKPATATEDRQCLSISQCLQHQFEVTSQTIISDRVCSNLTECSSDQFVLEESNQTSDRVCSALTGCSSNQYESIQPSENSDRNCSIISLCSEYEYEVIPPTETSDRDCSELAECSQNEFESSEPTETADRDCQALSNCSETQYESSVPVDGIYKSDRVCVDKTDCDDSEYEVGKFENGTTQCATKLCTCTNGFPAEGINCDQNGTHICDQCNHDYWLTSVNRTCLAITECSQNEYELISESDNSDRACKALTICNENEYVEQAETDTSDRICGVLKTCQPNEYEASAPTDTEDRVCELIITCLETEFETHAPNVTSNRLCQELTVCSETQFETLTPGQQEDRTCGALTICNSTQFETNAAGTTTDRECGTLTVCGSNEYEPSGPKDIYLEDRVCLEFTECAPGFYKVGEDENGDICVKKICVCVGGSPAEGEDCPNNGDQLCTGCADDAYIPNNECILATVCSPTEHETIAKTDTSDRECSANVCTCDGGVPDPDCATHQQEICIQCGTGRFLNLATACQSWSTCETGYHPEGGSTVKDTICVINTCSCPSGIPATGIECLENGAAKCGNCPLGTYLEASGTSCKSFVCTCSNGNPATGYECASDSEICVACRYPYTLTGIKCIDCDCENGQPTSTCSLDGPKCESCHFGYKLQSDTCQENRCYCNYGVANSLCEENNQESCKSCFLHYDKVDNVCKPSNVRGAVQYSFFLTGNVQNKTEIENTIWNATGLVTTLVDSRLTSKGYRYEMISKDNTTLSIGALRTVSDVFQGLPTFRLSRLSRVKDVETSSESISLATLIGIVSGIVILALAIGLSVYFCKRRQNKEYQRVPMNPNGELIL